MSKVYRTIAQGTTIQALEHIKSTGNGWHHYRVADDGPAAGELVVTRQWYAHPNPMGAILSELGYCASRLRIAAICLADPSIHPTRAREIKEDVKAETRLHCALLAQAQMIASKAGLLSGNGERSSDGKR